MKVQWFFRGKDFSGRFLGTQSPKESSQVDREEEEKTREETYNKLQC